MSTPIRAQSELTPAPRTVPIENAAWNCDRIERPMSRWIAAALVLMGTLASGPETSLMKRPARNSGTDRDVIDNATRNVPRAKVRVASVNVLRDPILATMAPARRTAISAPTAPTTSSDPHSVAVRSSRSRTAGRRAIQAAKPMPIRRKVASRARRDTASCADGRSDSCLHCEISPPGEEKVTVFLSSKWVSRGCG